MGYYWDDKFCAIPQTGLPSVGAAEGLQEVTAGYLHHVENVAVNELGGLGDAMCSAVGTGLYKDSQEAFVIAVARMDSGHTNHSITIDHESRTNHTLIDLAV